MKIGLKISVTRDDGVMTANLKFQIFLKLSMYEGVQERGTVLSTPAEHVETLSQFVAASPCNVTLSVTAQPAQNLDLNIIEATSDVMKNGANCSQHPNIFPGFPGRPVCTHAFAPL